MWVCCDCIMRWGWGMLHVHVHARRGEGGGGACLLPVLHQGLPLVLPERLSLRGGCLLLPTCSRIRKLLQVPGGGGEGGEGERAAV